MKKILFFLVIIFCLPLAFADSVDVYLVEIGQEYINQGLFQEAKAEFEKALQVNPANEKAKEYLNQIRQQEIEKALDKYSESETAVAKKPGQKIVKKKDKVSSGKSLLNKANKTEEKESKLSLSGDYQLSFGVESGETIWKRANADLNEENWRILSDTAYNRRENSFDPAIFSRLSFQLDYPQEQGWGFYGNFDISPWSFIGKSNKVTVSAGGDSADIQYLYWSNDRYTVNQSVNTNLLADSFNLPEVKVVDGKVHPVTVEGMYGNTFDIPELEINRDFWPLRELEFSYQGDPLSLKVFPAALEDADYISDDPLKITGNRTYWEESQWLVNWEPGILESGAAPVGYYKGKFDDALAYYTRDSSGTRLTTLRGFALNYDLGGANIDFTAASPKELWQDYGSFNTWESALRAKYLNLDNIVLGFTYGGKFGYNQRALDVFNNVFGLDANIGLGENTELLLEGLTSYTEADRTSDYETEKRGNAFHVSLVNSSSGVFSKDYFGVQPEKNEPFYKLRLSLTHMDQGFESALASYRQTRDDEYWSRHITFREPFDSYRMGGLYGPSLSWDDVEPFRIGDGIDYGRDVISLRVEWENLLDDRLDALFDVRNVHDVNGKFLENVARLEGQFKLTDKLTTKFLGIYQKMPDTTAGIDPFIFDPQTGDYYNNDKIEDGKDPSLKTVGLGANYDFFKWLNLNFSWEHSNDVTLAYDNFPRSILNSVDWWTTTTEDNNTFYQEVHQVYNNQYFPLPPYPYFDIFKVGLGFRPTDKINLYLDYTRNEYYWAQIIDENMNHIGVSASYLPNEKIGFYLRYVYSKVNDLSELNNDSRVVKRTHHTVFSEVRFRLEETSELIAQYGVGNTGGILESTYTPFGGGVPTLDTQHIFRVYYRKKF
ncbi:MAG: hypothetical protein K9L84_02630 [Candidatus Omnitrophica bacterium]|nr:hypothetical protein [Candidatus Omnitrophota bacterium]MCF7893937.1 hypothetical protein [Candidatus Omnitrophota bacterium]